MGRVRYCARVGCVPSSTQMTTDRDMFHVIQAGKEAVFNLQCPDGPPELRENYGFSLRGLRRIKAILAVHLGHLCQRWRAIHGEP
jgi:hypothetical protein